jgi:hypothetical protein
MFSSPDPIFAPSWKSFSTEQALLRRWTSPRGNLTPLCYPSYVLGASRSSPGARPGHNGVEKTAGATRRPVKKGFQISWWVNKVAPCMKSKRHIRFAFPLLALIIAASAASAAQGVQSEADAAHGEIWSLLLNTFKTLGLIIGGIAGVLGTLHETKTEDKKHLTRHGHLLLRLGIFGFSLAVLAQLIEWKKSKLDAEATQNSNTIALREIRRAATRLQTVSLDSVFDLPISNAWFADYKQDLTTRVIGAVQSKQDLYQGLRTVLNSQEGPITFWIEPDSEAMPDEKKHQIVRGYVDQLIPRIALFKRPIEATNFWLPSVSYIVTPGREASADLLLIPEPGNLSLFVDLSSYDLDFEELPSIRRLKAQRRGMNVSPWASASSGDIVSVGDLSGCQAIIYFHDPRVNLRPLWESTKISLLKLYVNGLAISIDGSKLVPARAMHRDLVYTYIFPAPLPKR